MDAAEVRLWALLEVARRARDSGAPANTGGQLIGLPDSEGNMHNGPCMP